MPQGLWVQLPPRAQTQLMYSRKTRVNQDRNLQAYIIGLAIGDGNLSNPNSRATRLRITCDRKYPALIEKIKISLHQLLPQNKVSIVERKGCVDISVYSNHLEKILGWQSQGGSKFTQNVSVPNWVKEKNDYKISCLKGLIETDGSIYLDRGYKMMMFSTIIPKLAADAIEIIKSLGFHPRLYKIKHQSNKDNFNRRPIYRIRISNGLTLKMEV